MCEAFHVHIATLVCLGELSLQHPLLGELSLTAFCNDNIGDRLLSPNDVHCIVKILYVCM